MWRLWRLNRPLAIERLSRRRCAVRSSAGLVVVKLKNKISIALSRQLAPGPGRADQLWVALVLLFVAAYLATAMLTGPLGGMGLQFQEGGAVDIMTAVFLVAASVLAAACFRLRRADPDARRIFWLLLSAGFLFVSLDELFEFHENLDYWLRDEGLAGWPSLFRNWNDVILIAYGVAGLAVLAWFWSEIGRLPRVAPLLGLGILCYALHTGIDSTMRGSVLKDLFEESAKLFAAAFFALAMRSAVGSMAARR